MIPGCRTIDRLDENANVVDIELFPEDVSMIRKLVEDAEVSGDRYPEGTAKEIGRDSLSLSQWKP